MHLVYVTLPWCIKLLVVLKLFSYLKEESTFFIYLMAFSVAKIIYLVVLITVDIFK